ncbi:hypothetical protein NPX13_g5247 [Xylaria arbuscula]|uniref:Uncharacterized protein n=1 Tax=Xylaria arbuscula TaxID=114810 RepID=A0A9W8NEY8_9PEZI|nr:hypothetical protein NPX13_g5247 [Xylaria arbuscula]
MDTAVSENAKRDSRISEISDLLAQLVTHVQKITSDMERANTGPEDKDLNKKNHPLVQQLLHFEEGQTKLLKAQTKLLQAAFEDIGILKTSQKSHTSELRQQHDALVTRLENNPDKLLKTYVQQCEQKLASFTNGFHTTLKTQGEEIQRVLGQLDEVQALTRKTSAAHRDDEYLKLQCPVPPGANPEKYRSSLVRAAWYYITYLGSPDDGVFADEQALEVTKAKFPHLQMNHIAKALEYVHMQAYERPIRRNQDRGE